VESSFDRSLTIGIFLLVPIVVDGSSSLIGSVGCLSKAVCTCYLNLTQCSRRGVCQLGFREREIAHQEILRYTKTRTATLSEIKDRK
jgi:hypothetical protein